MPGRRNHLAKCALELAASRFQFPLPFLNCHSFRLARVLCRKQEPLSPERLGILAWNVDSGGEEQELRLA